LEDGQILFDLLDDAGPAYLDHHLSAIGQCRGVGLADRGRGKRRGVEDDKAGRDRLAQLHAKRLLDHVPGYWRRGVLQFGQFCLILRRQQVGAGREDLAQLDERGAEFFEGHADVLGPGVGLRAARVAEQSAVEGHEALQPEHADQVAQPMATQNLGDLARATQGCISLSIHHAVFSWVRL
jgi:hypothetical protein